MGYALECLYLKSSKFSTGYHFMCGHRKIPALNWHRRKNIAYLFGIWKPGLDSLDCSRFWKIRFYNDPNKRQQQRDDTIFLKCRFHWCSIYIYLTIQLILFYFTTSFKTTPQWIFISTQNTNKSPHRFQYLNLRYRIISIIGASMKKKNVKYTLNQLIINLT